MVIELIPVSWMNPRTQLWQWDLNRQVKIKTKEDVSEVHFAQTGDVEALVVKTVEEDGYFVADIPNIMLQNSRKLTVYIVKNDVTIGSWTYSVVKRERPADYVYTETEVKRYDDLERRISALEKNTVSDEVIAEAVKKYLEENEITGGSSARIGEVTLTAEGWVGEESPYSQIVNIEGVTENSQVDLTPSIEQLAVFYEKDLTFTTKNVGGVVTVYAVGQKPLNDYTIQVTITEVYHE